MDRFDYDFDKLTNQNALYSNDVSNNVKDLFNELEDVEQTTEDIFTLDNSFVTPSESVNASLNIVEDNMNKTQEIDFADQLIASGDLETIKALQAQMHELAEDKPEENELQNEEQGMSQEKGKVLTKSTKAGKAFANNEIANAFINCSILGFITAFIGGSMFVYILNHLG